MNKIRILLADDHAIVREGLSLLLGFQRDFAVVGEAVDGRDAVRKAAELTPDVVLLDLMMPELDGADATREILKASPETRILLLTTFGESADLNRAFENGAKGAITKDLPKERIFDAIRKTADGECVLSPEIEQSLQEEGGLNAVSDRQRDILDGLARGLTNRDIACQLRLSEAGVKFHLLKIFRLLGAANRSEAAAIALRRHLLKSR